MPIEGGLARRAGQAEAWATSTSCTSVGAGCRYASVFCEIYENSVRSPVHDFPSLETTLPAGQVATQFPPSRKSPGRHSLHWGCGDVEALTSKLGIEHFAHLDGHVSHTPLPMLATSEVPWHVPVLSADKHCPPRRNVPVGHLVQSVGLGPLHSPQAELQEAQVVPDWNLPTAQVVSLIHWVRLFLSWMVPFAQVVQAVAEQEVQAAPQDKQLPLLGSRKKPVSHVAHAVPLEALAHPVTQVQVPDEPQEPFEQLHLEGEVDGSGVERHAPVPDGPSSHLSQLLGHSEKKYQDLQ